MHNKTTQLLLLLVAHCILALPREAYSELSDIQALSGGIGHMCVKTNGGALKCWGLGSSGQLGNGMPIYSLVPGIVSGFYQGAAAVYSGGNNSCVLTISGGVKCWGDNASGEVGRGDVGGTVTIPVQVVGLTSGVSKIFVGRKYSCVVTSEGAAKCWGHNYYSQLGNGSFLDSGSPAQVVGLESGVSSISVSRDSDRVHTCALTTGGGVKCWGFNYNGQLGDGTTTNSSVPVDVVGLSSGVSSVHVGREFTCAITQAGGVKCWGKNHRGQLGDGTTTESFVPVDVSGLSSGVQSISLGDSLVCAVLTSGGVKCWGKNNEGQLGDGTNSNSSIPVDVSGLTSGVASVLVAGPGDASHVCAITSGGALKCWGYNYTGQLGNGTLTNSNMPVAVNDLTTGVVEMHLSSQDFCGFTCVRTSTGSVKCFGCGDGGRLGDGAGYFRSSPTGVTGMYWLGGTVRSGTQGLEGVSVFDPLLGSQTTDSSGWYVFPSVAEGQRYTLLLYKEGYQFSPFSVGSTVVADTANDFSVVVTPTSIPNPTATSIQPTAIPTAIPTVPEADVVAPAVKAKKASGKAGAKIRFVYTVSEASGQSADSISIRFGTRVRLRFSKALAQIPSNATRSITHTTKGLRRGSYRYCVIATDPFGNASKSSCASLVLR